MIVAATAWWTVPGAHAQTPGQFGAPSPVVQVELPPDFAPWWQVPARGSLKPRSEPLEMTLDNVVLGTLIHSPTVRVLTDAPIIRRQSILEAEARFDPRNFLETRWVDTSDPVGNLLTTGGAKRFIDQNGMFNGGARKLTQQGTQVELAQRFGYQDNNSIFFVPAPQGTSRITLGVTQPLLAGRGKAYNTSLIVLADINTRIAQDELSKNLQALLFDVHKAYWELHQARAVLLQKRKVHAQAVAILDELNARGDVDVLGSQLVRARAAVAQREAAIIRGETTVRNCEARLRALVNDPALAVGDAQELVPIEQPNRGLLPLGVEDSLVTAMQFRPEVNVAIKEIKAATVRANVSKNELMPILNLVMGGYITGLQGGANVAQAWTDQFSVGRPTYSAGLVYERPFGNRAPTARYQQRLLELRQATNQLQSTMATIRAEVEVAAREVTTTYQEMIAKYHAMTADAAEIEYLADRWRLLPGDQQVAGVVLEDLLDAQDRLADNEQGFATAQTAYNLSLINLKKTTGTLLEYQELKWLETTQNGLPTTLIDKNPTPPPAEPPSVPPPTHPPAPAYNAPAAPWLPPAAEPVATPPRASTVPWQPVAPPPAPLRVPPPSAIRLERLPRVR